MRHGNIERVLAVVACVVEIRSGGARNDGIAVGITFSIMPRCGEFMCGVVANALGVSK
jgi:hypothetical protein